MKFSIVTISYNLSKYLERTILSVLQQKNSNFEYIIVDAGSTDGSRDIIKKHKSKFAKIILEKDDGPAHGLNKGFEYATGDIFGFINSDDTYEKDCLKNVEDFFKKKQDAYVLCGKGYKIDANDKKIRRVYPDKFSLTKYIYGTYNFIQPSSFIRKEAFRSVGGFNIANKTCWDAELLVDIALKGMEIKRFNKFLSNFRIHDSSISGTGRLLGNT